MTNPSHPTPRPQCLWPIDELKRLLITSSLACLSALPSFAALAEGEPACAGTIGKATATAASWANLRGSSGSLKTESSRLLSEGVSALQRCSCQAQLHFSSVPAKYRSGYTDEAVCVARENATRAQPISFENRRFPTLPDLQSWFADFSQGAGSDGKELYRVCDGSCSPQYFLTVTPAENGYRVNASVICGRARDKDDNNYELEAKLTCQ